MLRKVQNKKDVLRTHTLLIARVASSKPQEDRGSQNCPMVVFGTEHGYIYIYLYIQNASLCVCMYSM